MERLLREIGDGAINPAGGALIRSRFSVPVHLQQGRCAEAMTDANSTSAEAAGLTAATKPGMKWYVLRVASNKEEQVRDGLERKIRIEGLEDRVGRILVPTLKEKRMRGGVLRVVERKLS